MKRQKQETFAECDAQQDDPALIVWSLPCGFGSDPAIVLSTVVHSQAEGEHISAW